MTDFSPLQALGPMTRARPGRPPWDEHLDRYFEHYRLTPLLTEHVGVHVGFVDAGGFRLWTQVWSPHEPHGTAFVVHGYFDHLGLYRHLLEWLLERNWRVVLWDLPGHGLSSGERASIGDFDEYGHCLSGLQQHLASCELAPRPWIGLGQSTGAAILATDALRRGEACHWDGLALLAPLVRPWGWQQSSWIHLLASPFIRTLPRKYRANSTDGEFATFLREHDPLQPDRVMIPWVSAMRRWMPRLLALPPNEVPVMILQGEQDMTVDWEWNLDVLMRKFPNATVFRHPEARHHLVNETQAIRSELFEALDGFLASLASASPVSTPSTSDVSGDRS